MLQIILAILLLLAPGAYAQSGVVTSMQRPGGVPQRILDKLNALETKKNDVTTAFNTVYNGVSAIANASCTAASSVYMNSTCTPFARSRDSLVVARGTLGAGSSGLTGSTPLAKLQSQMDSWGCPISTWAPCTMDNLRQAFTIRNSSAASNLFSGLVDLRFLGFDGGHALRTTTTTAVTLNACNGYTATSSFRGEVIYHALSESTINAGFATGLCASTSANAACCHY